MSTLISDHLTNVDTITRKAGEECEALVELYKQGKLNYEVWQLRQKLIALKATSDCQAATLVYQAAYYQQAIHTQYQHFTSLIIQPAL